MQLNVYAAEPLLTHLYMVDWMQVSTLLSNKTAAQVDLSR